MRQKFEQSKGVSARYNGHTCEGGVYDIEENLNDRWIS